MGRRRETSAGHVRGMAHMLTSDKAKHNMFPQPSSNPNPEPDPKPPSRPHLVLEWPHEALVPHTQSVLVPVGVAGRHGEQRVLQNTHTHI